MDEFVDNIEVVIPDGASAAEEERLIQAAIDAKLERDLDNLLGDTFD